MSANQDGALADAETPIMQIARLHAERDRARLLARNLFQMVDRQAWRDSGGDDGQSHYEGDYHAEKVWEEIKSWMST